MCFGSPHRARERLHAVGHLLPGLDETGRGLCSLCFPGLPAAMGGGRQGEGAGVLLTSCAVLAGCGTPAHPARWDGVMGRVDGLELGPHCKRSTVASGKPKRHVCCQSMWSVCASLSKQIWYRFCTIQWSHHCHHLPTRKPPCWSSPSHRLPPLPQPRKKLALFPLWRRLTALISALLN